MMRHSTGHEYSTRDVYTTAKHAMTMSSATTAPWTTERVAEAVGGGGAAVVVEAGGGGGGGDAAAVVEVSHVFKVNPTDA